MQPIIHDNRKRFPLCKWCRPLSITVNDLVVWSGHSLDEVTPEQWQALSQVTKEEKWSLYGAIKAML